ncbi:hypothetical protein IC006_2098 [Sulfuracidifex tepidarius]|uniref:ABC transmembrane type-1 domain-containing protein n=1 Tax=Sulfuracidifex tepidarius TaxID=1294262 RepID=A0A510DX43_9CREN|nr:ABC transporter permease subunit [Sulfuracidifex tepidarius]BBG24764.1 hypothetical protein IC006_2098 [Sulfuracidifex tepidarius]
MNPVVLATLGTMATTGRVLGLILFSIVSGWLLAYASVKSKPFENIYIPLIEVLESVPVFSFFPIVLLFFVTDIGGPLGVELAADFLVFTAVVWNIWMGAYQAFKTVPNEMLEVAENYKMGLLARLKNVYIPFSIPRIATNLLPSFSDGMFYITVSEVFSVGVHIYQTFGIGAVITDFMNEGNYNLVGLSLLVLGIFTTGIVLLLREYSNYAVAKYGLDSNLPVSRRGRIHFGNSARLINTLSSAKRLSIYTNKIPYRSVKEKEDEYYMEEKGRKWLNYVGAMIGLVLLLAIVYGAFSVITSVSGSTWSYLLSQVPSILVGLGYDYLRVTFITVLAFLLSITLGYYLAIHNTLDRIFIPLIQAFSAFPAPAYFPFLFGFLYGYTNVFGPFKDEFFIILLGFISTFYYVFFSFWMGVKALPSEYWEVMQNYNMGYWTKMRKIILPGTMPYLVAGISSTVNSAWGGLAIGEYWPQIYNNYNLIATHGVMAIIDNATATGNLALGSWASFIFAVVVVIYALLFTRNLMEIARKKYIAEEGIYAA